MHFLVFSDIQAVHGVWNELQVVTFTPSCSSLLSSMHVSTHPKPMSLITLFGPQYTERLRHIGSISKRPAGKAVYSSASGQAMGTVVMMMSNSTCEGSSGPEHSPDS